MFSSARMGCPAATRPISGTATTLLSFACISSISTTSRRLPTTPTTSANRSAPALALTQVALGVLTILTFKGLVPVTAHLLVAALLLADFVALLAVTRSSPASDVAPAALGVAA